MSSDMYLRRLSLIVGTGGSGIELAPPGDQLSIRFTVSQWDLQTPNHCSIRVLNLKDDTAQQIDKEFTQVVLQAGYENGSYGVLFSGTIVQVKRGRENAVNTYVDIVGAEGDEATNFSVVNTTLAAGSTFADRVAALTKAMAPAGVSSGYVAPLPANQLPRGKVMYGMARDHLRDLAFSTDTDWSIQKGQLQVVARGGSLPTDPVRLTSLSGMIGLPEQTQEGIKIRSLLNPMFQPGGRVQVDNKSIQQASLDIGLQGVATNAFLPSITDDGVYRIVVASHTGMTRGNDWYTDLTCVAQGQAATPSLVARGYS